MSLRRFLAATRREGIRAVSVDVFDTLLFRTSTPEIVKFHRIGRQQARALRDLGASPPEPGMLQLRLLAAEVAYRNSPLVHGAREPTIDVIHGIMADHLIAAGRLPAQQRGAAVQQLLAVELAEEVRDLRPNRPLLAGLIEARAQGMVVVAISDMYLRREHIRHLIDAAGAGEGVSDVYVSSELGFGKASGVLFRHVCEELGIAPGELLHVGDNRHADFRMAIASGVRAYYVPRSVPWRGTREARRRLFLRRLERAT